MTAPHDAERTSLLNVLDRIWSIDPDVRRFGLSLLADRIAPMYGAWIVPVVSDVEGGSAYDLSRVLNRIEEQAESLSRLSITLMLDPGFPAVNGGAHAR